MQVHIDSDELCQIIIEHVKKNKTLQDVTIDPEEDIMFTLDTDEDGLPEALNGVLINVLEEKS
jgi:hypothetical protein